MSAAVRPFVTPQEYLDREIAAETRSEYINGQIYAMSGAKRAHILVAGNIGLSLSARLRGRPCETYIAEMRVKVSATGAYLYPDVSVVCGDPVLEDAGVDMLLNPTVLFEVLSPSTEGYDRGEKFAHYRRLPSLREYVLVAQDRARVEHFARVDGEGDRWVLTTVEGLDGVVDLPALGVALPLAEVYERVAPFPPEPPPRPPVRAVAEPAAGAYAAG